MINDVTVWWRHRFVVLHVYPPVSRKRQTLTDWMITHFSLQRLLRAWRNLAPAGSFLLSNFPVDFFESLSTKWDACSKPPSSDNHRKASYPRTQQRDRLQLLTPSATLLNCTGPHLTFDVSRDGAGPEVGDQHRLVAIRVDEVEPRWVDEVELRCVAAEFKQPLCVTCVVL